MPSTARGTSHPTIRSISSVSFISGRVAAGTGPTGTESCWQIVGNHVHDNNMPNTVTGGLVALLPPGGGILVIGVDNVNVDSDAWDVTSVTNAP